MAIQIRLKVVGISEGEKGIYYVVMELVCEGGKGEKSPSKLCSRMTHLVLFHLWGLQGSSPC